MLKGNGNEATCSGYGLSGVDLDEHRRERIALEWECEGTRGSAADWSRPEKEGRRTDG